MFEHDFSNNEQRTTSNLPGVARTLTAAAALALALAVPLPTLANPGGLCGAQTTDGLPGTSDTITCDPTEAYPDGITYSSDGDLDLLVDFADNGAFLSRPVPLDVEDDGLNVTGNGADDISLDFEVGSFRRGSRMGGVPVEGTAGAVVNYLSEDGDIDMQLWGVTAEGAATHAVRAESTGTGNITIVHDSDDASNNTFADIESVGIGIEAITTSGDIVINHNDGSFSAALDTIRAETTDGGAIAVNFGGNIIIDLNEGGTLNVGGSDARIRSVPTGDAVINLAVGASSGAPPDGVFADMTAPVGTTTTLNLDGRVGSNDNGVTTERALVTGAGAGEIVINNTGGLYGGVDFTGMPGDVTFNNFGPSDEEHLEAGWAMGNGDFAFGAGNDTINNQSGATISTGSIPNSTVISPAELVETTIDFGPGEDTFNNAGALLVSESRFVVAFPPSGGGDPISINRWRVASEVSFSNLETFDNTGVIVMGGYISAAHPFLGLRRQTLATEFVDCTPNAESLGFDFGPTSCLDFTRINDSDWEWNDVLAMPGTDFVGSGDSAIMLDAALHLGDSQSNCYDNRDGVENIYRLPGADCVDLTGGSTAGHTGIIVRDRQEGDQSAYNPEGMVIVDVGGGTTAAGHFTISPESDHYNARYGTVDKGLFMYLVDYDAANQQHRLVGVPNETAMHMPLLVQGAQEISRAATTAWRDRRGHARNAPDRDTDHGVWAHISQARGERDTQQSISTAYGQRIDFGNANDFEQDTLTVTLGNDFIIGGGDESAWVVGGTLGYSRAQLDFNASPVRKQADFEGASAGVYGSFETDRLFLDAAANYGRFALDDIVPSLDLVSAEGKILGFLGGSPAFTNAVANRETNTPNTDVYTLGAYAEGGMRFEIGDLLQVEPLAALSFASADFDGMDVPSADDAAPGVEVFGDGAHDSLRGGLGARLRADSTVGNLLLRYSLTGRFWEEFEDETEVRIASNGPDATVTDEFGGSFVDVRAGVSLSDLTGSVSGYLNLDALSGDDYDSLGVSAGFRYQW